MNTETTRRDAIKDYYSAKSEYWASLYSQTGARKNWIQLELAKRKEIVFDLISKIRTPALRTVLDMGCGSGQYLAELVEMGFECTGADISEKMLDIARNEIAAHSSSQAILINADCSHLPLDDNSFDLVLSIGLLEYLDSEVDALWEIRRLLDASGYAIVTLPNLYKLRNLVNPYYYFVRIWTYFFKQGNLDGPQGTKPEFDYVRSTATRYSLPRAKRILQQSGFDVIDVRSCCFGPFSIWKPYHSPETSGKTSSRIEGLLKYRIFGFLNYFANRWVMLIQPVANRRE